MASTSGSNGDEGFQQCEEENVDLECLANSKKDSDPIPDCEGIVRDGWSGKELLAKHEDGSDFVDVIIITANPDACVDSNRRLGKHDVGIVVLGVCNGDSTVGDTCLHWPLHRVFYQGETGLVSVYDHAHKQVAIDEELERNKKRAGKRKYRYEKRIWAPIQEDSHSKMVEWESIVCVFDQTCYDKQCTQRVPPTTICTLRTKLYHQSFQVKSSKLLEVHRTIHLGPDSMRKAVTVEGIDICLHAWRLVHNVSLRTFQRYKAKADVDVRGAPHGNSNRAKTRTAIVQAIQMLRSLLEASADLMPHLTRTLHTREKVGLKVLPSGMQWNHLLASVNEVRIIRGVLHETRTTRAMLTIGSQGY